MDYIIGQEHLKIEMSNEQRDEILEGISIDITKLWEDLRKFRPNDRSELARRFSIAITQLEILDGYIAQYILRPIGSNK